MKKLVAMVILAALALNVWACGGNEDSELRDADEVREQQTAASATSEREGAKRLGESVELNNGIVVTVSSATRKAPADMGGRQPTTPHASWLVVAVVIENRGEQPVPTPDLTVVCADGGQGNRYSDTSPEGIGNTIPPKSRDDGNALIGVPAACPSPILTAKATGGVVGPVKTGSWELP